VTEGSTAGRPADREDLAAMATRLARALTAAELPVLRALDLSMWGYVVLLTLGGRPVRTQAALARTIGADPTRLIGVLDELQRHGLIRRRPDPADRRVHLLSLTAAGQRRLESARAGIRRREERVLARLPTADRDGFLRALQTLSALPATEITGADDPDS
jgi:DNA-binding MarR family transcriptional regulator